MKGNIVFRKAFALCALAFVLVMTMGSCTKSQDNTNSSNVNFTLDITNGANTTLNIVGGFVVLNGTIVIKYAPNVFYALSAACPNDGITVTYDPGTIRVICPNDGSAFNPATGSVLNGPATKSLIKYTVTQTGNILTIRS